VGSNPISSTNFKAEKFTTPQVQKFTTELLTGIHCNPHSFRRGFAVHLVKSGLSTRVVQSLGGWETIAMVERYTRSLDFDDGLQPYKQVNGSEA